MNCPYCGAPVPAGGAFCPVCGQRMTSEPAEAPAKRKANWLMILGLVVLVVGGGVCLLAGGGGALYLLLRPAGTPTVVAINTSTAIPVATRITIFTATPAPTRAVAVQATATKWPTLTPTSTATKVPPLLITPRLTRTPANTPTAVPDGLIYAEDFGTDTGDWYTGVAPESVIEIEDGRMSIRVKPEQILIRESAPANATDVAFSVMAYPQPGAPDAQYGLFCREEDDDNYYLAGVSMYSQYQFYKCVDGEWVELIPWTLSIAIKTDQNELRLVCAGDQIAFYANDELLFSQTDDSFSYGEIGFYAATGDTPNAEVQFDDFVAWEPVPGDLPAVAPTATPRPAVPTATPRAANPTPTTGLTWADYLYLDLLQTKSEYTTVKGWYDTLYAGGSVRCPSQTYALHRPSYVIPPELPALRSIYDRYLAAIAMIDGTGGVIGPVDRVQLLCKEGKDIGQADMDFDMAKLVEAGGILDGLILETSNLR